MKQNAQVGLSKEFLDAAFFGFFRFICLTDRPGIKSVPLHQIKLPADEAKRQAVCIFRNDLVPEMMDLRASQRLTNLRGLFSTYQTPFLQQNGSLIGSTIPLMFSYDQLLCDTAATAPQSIADVLRTLEAIDAICIDGDGLKWFNWLYLQVTQAVETRVASGTFSEPAWLPELDVQFARLYLSALQASLSGQPTPDCWQTLFARRDQTSIARIQFALAGINAHINHDLPEAIVATCESTATVPTHGTPQFQDYTSLNPTLDGIIEFAKRTLHVRLLGDALPAASHLEDLIAAWGVSAAREAAWDNAELLWHLRQTPPLSSVFMDTLDGLTTVTNKALLVPVP